MNKGNDALKEPKLKSSIALVESSKVDSSDFGSGFLIHRDKKATYWLTCAHVVNAIGAEDRIRVGKLPAELVGLTKQDLSSLKDSFDLAILKVEGLFKKKPVQLGKPIVRDLRFQTLGHFQNTKTKQLYLREVSGSLHVDSLNLVARESYAWVLDLKMDEKFLLQPGYSGSPVFIPYTRQVIGVVEQRKDSGKKGKAIAVDAANSIFRKVPELKHMLRSQTSQNSSSHRMAKFAMDVIEYPLRLVIGSQVRAALDWLLQEGFSNLAAKASNYARENSNALNAELQQFSEEDREKVFTEFQWEIEKYLERIYSSLLTDSQDLLEKNIVRPTLSSAAYESAFVYIRNSIPDYISEKASNKINRYVAVLIEYLYSDS